ncbi:flagellar biosynthesis protein FlgM [Mycoplasmopsis bovirhinis]|uniref:M13 family metallopeptidase n=1 Tax=Mycoplasmopsis bovirhinis TaxID=29553 RepID=UPI000C05B2D4|nr:M13 family metallopeptidase [Mycoplasmopsis bovirhinis]ATO31011.1 flagellar biosynthesis protein FlgM [Mycoplasmopsis bovirhinis]
MKPNLKDNYFKHINHDWLQTTKIPADRSSIGSFVEMDIKLEKLLKDEITSWSKDPKTLPNDSMIHEYTKFYNMVLDINKRNQLGWDPIRKYLNKLERLNSFEELFNQDRDFWLTYSNHPFDIFLFEDFVDNTKHILWLSNPSGTILPSKETYDNFLETQKLIEVWKDMVFKLLTSYGKSSWEALDLINKAVEFDLYYKDFLLSSVEEANFVALYNLQERNSISKFSKKYDLLKIIDLVLGQKIASASVINQKFFENFDLIYSKERFESYKAHMFIFNLLAQTNNLSEEIRLTANEFKKALYSIEKARSLEDFAYDKTNGFFGMPLGMYYARTYFGKKAKKDVENMVQSMINVYKKRLQANTWLSKETIAKAIVKLDHIQVMIGYPEIIRPYYKQFKVTTYQEGSNLFENTQKFSKLMVEYKLSLYLKEEDKRYWTMSPATINAYYSPLQNKIVFPAAILAWPFYSIDRNSSANYGGIGAVIAHEISHGFDNNGSQFDEKGSLNNWWTEEDLAQFKEKTKAAIELFDQRETDYGKVNGKLTVSENIADLGGFSCALESAKSEPDFSLEEFFISWATIWRSIYKEGAAKRQLETDVHSPTEIRANVILANNDDFVQHYDIKPGDKMYIEPSKRVKIW